MLIDFSVGNFRSFGDIQTLSMIASTDPLLSSHVISDEAVLKRKNIKLLRNVVIYGANASGKSNLCDALKCMTWLVCNSATKLNHRDELPNVSPFRLRADLEAQPSSFEVRVLIDGGVYRYGFEATRRQIVREWLYVTRPAPRSREIALFERDGTDSKLWRFGVSLTGRADRLRQETRESNCLLLSKGAQINIRLLRDVFDWFRRLEIGSNFGAFSGDVESLLVDSMPPTKGAFISPAWIAKVTRVADPGVASVEVGFGPPKRPSALVPDCLPSEKGHKLKFMRSSGDSSETRSFDIEDESSGTRRFLEVAWLAEVAFVSGVIAVIDEFNSSLHPLLTREIVAVMNDPDLGSGTAQFIVTTHDSNLLDRDQLRRDQIWFTEKGVDGQTELYSLYDIKEKPKVDAAFERQYLASRFGGVPKVGNLRLAIADGIAEALAEFNEREKAAVSAKE